MATALRLGTRGSALAVAQSSAVARDLEALGADVELVTIRTSGDETAPKPDTEDVPNGSDASGADVDGDQVQVQTHAWFEAAVPDWGWLALDPTNAQQVGQRHIAIGHGRDYHDVPPVRGVYSGGGRPSTDAVVEIRRHAPAVHQAQAQQQQQLRAGP